MTEQIGQMVRKYTLIIGAEYFGNPYSKTQKQASNLCIKN